MTVLDLPAPTVSVRAPIELRLGRPLLADARDLRAFRFIAGAALIMFPLAGWVADPTGDDWLYTMWSIVGYLLAGAVLNLLAVLPTVHRGRG